MFWLSLTLLLVRAVSRNRQEAAPSQAWPISLVRRVAFPFQLQSTHTEVYLCSMNIDFFPPMCPWDAYNLQQDPVFLQFLFFCLIYYGELKIHPTTTNLYLLPSQESGSMHSTFNQSPSPHGAVVPERNTNNKQKIIRKLCNFSVGNKCYEKKIDEGKNTQAGLRVCSYCREKVTGW